MTDPQDPILRLSLIRPNEQEEQLLAGKTGRDYVSLARDLLQGATINQNHYNFFKSLTDDFRETLLWKGVGDFNNLEFEKDAIKKGSLHLTSAFGATTETVRDKEFLSLNIFSTLAQNDLLFATMMTSPVKWHMDHIQTRMKERGATPLEDSGSAFIQHNAMAISILRILEEEQENVPRDYHPFMLPERNGVLLGHTMPFQSSKGKNRVSLIATQTYNHPSFSNYDWIPTMNMTVRTFYGFNEMTPAMHTLRRQLLPFYGGQKAKALRLELDTMGDITANPSFNRHPQKNHYFNAFTDLADIVQSKAWRMGTVLPKHLGPSRHHGFF